MLTKKVNQRMVTLYYILALVFLVLGIYRNKAAYFLIVAIFLVLALVRRYWLMGKLKG